MRHAPCGMRTHAHAWAQHARVPRPPIPQIWYAHAWARIAVRRGSWYHPPMANRRALDDLAPLGGREVVRALARRHDVGEREILWALPWARLAQCPVAMVLGARRCGVPPQFLVEVARARPLPSLGLPLVEALWRRCDRRRARWAARTEVPVPRGLTEPEVRAYVRAARWAWRRLRLTPEMFSARALIALGRIAPWARYAALWRLWSATDRPAKIGWRHLDWALVARLQRVPEPRRALIAAAALSGWGAAERHLVGPAGLKGVSAGALAPAYPRVSRAVAARLALGESPAAICGGVLTAREAHEWFLAGGPPEGAPIQEEAIRHLARDLNLPGRVEELEPAVVRWLVRRQDEVRAWVRDGRLSLAAMELLALAAEEDLRGQKSLQGLLRRLTIKAASDKPRQMWRLPLPPEARHLASDRALKVEGLEMAHCIGTYTLGVWWENTYPFALEDHEGRSTLTLSRSASGEWFVDQHRGRANSTPPTSHVQIVAAWLEQLNSLRAPTPAKAAEGGWGPTPAAA